MMLRTILSVPTGLALAFVVMSLIQFLSTLLYPMPPDVIEAYGAGDKEVLGAWIAQLPEGALALVLLSYALSSFGGGWLAALISRRRLWPALIVGMVLTGLGFVNLSQIPHPLWFAAASTLCFILLALLGGRLGARRS